MQIDTTARTPTLNSFERPLNTAVFDSKISKNILAYKKKGPAFAGPFSMKSF